MHRVGLIGLLLGKVAAILFLTAAVAHAGAAPSRYACRIVETYPHDPGAFTQGLVFDGGFLYESTGLNGKSTVREVEPATGKVLKRHDLPAEFFGEGLTLWNGKLVQLTWQTGVGFVYDKESFKPVREFRYETEGWGITHDGTSLIMSDGSATLRFLDPVNFSVTREIVVRNGGVPVTDLNELEYIKGEIFANVWRTDMIARISPNTGEVLGWIDLSGLRDALGPVRNAEVLNGIAYDALRNRIYVTGKLWPKIFEIEIIPVSP